MRKILEIILIILVPWTIIFWIVFTYNGDRDEKYFSKELIQVKHKKSRVNHSEYVVLQQKFESPQEMTAACLSCHNETGKEFMKTPHWQWKQKDTIRGRGVYDLGKVNLLNNFCVGINSNERMCSKCHAGFGYENKDFDFQHQNNIDCVVCHDKTGKYQKSKPEKGVRLSGSGYPEPGTDLNQVAQHVGYPEKNNCGSCHFVGGGGNNVKHGDLEKAQLHCTRELDVHMASKGKDAPNLNCQDCHKTEHHNITGHLYTVASSASNRTTCVQCHTEKPHPSKLLNDHFKTIACQTCHIPVYAKGAPTKIIWDWSTATQMGKNGKPVAGETLPGNKYRFDGKTYYNVKIHFDSKHGTAVFQKDVIPEYVWFNGTANHHLLNDKIIDTSSVLILNPLFGSYYDRINPADPENPSKIWPVKVMRGKQPYDPVNRLLINPKLVGAKNSGALWADYNWDASAKAGMDYVGLPYSGQHAFMKTETMWLLNHEVAPADQALQCAACHRNTQSKLNNLTGFYLPGRDKSSLLDNTGLLFVILVLMGVSIHGILRIVNNKRK